MPFAGEVMDLAKAPEVHQLSAGQMDMQDNTSGKHAHDKLDHHTPAFTLVLALHTSSNSHFSAVVT